MGLKRGIAIVDPPAPQNPVHVQVRIKPEDFYDDVRDSDYFVPPFCPVFVRSEVKASPFSKQYATKKNLREGIVHNAVCNFYNGRDEFVGRDVKGAVSEPGLRFIGVSYDGIADMKGAKQHPDSIGRFSVIVSGAVTIAVNPIFMEYANIGDTLHWFHGNNGLSYPTYQNDFSPVAISTDKKWKGEKAAGAIGMLIGFNAKRNEARVLLQPECNETNYSYTQIAVAKSSRPTPRDENAEGRSGGKRVAQELVEIASQELGEMLDDTLKDEGATGPNPEGEEGTPKIVFGTVEDRDDVSGKSISKEPDEALATAAKADEAGVPATKRRRRARPEFETYNG